MKNIILSISMFTIFLSSCTAIHDRLATGTVVRDCSGTYLRINDSEDYFICNSGLLDKKEQGEKVTIVYDFIKKCAESDGKLVCTLYHENKGKIYIKSIK